MRENHIYSSLFCGNKNVKFFHLKTNFKKIEFKNLLGIRLFDFILFSITSKITIFYSILIFTYRIIFYQ